jgi:CRP-like cAMP-binding protein
MTLTTSFLSSLPHLSALSVSELETLRPRLREVSYPAHRSLYHQEEPTPGLHIVVSGWVKLVRSSPAGRELMMGLAGPGDLFGPCCNPTNGGASPCGAVSQTLVSLLTMSASTWRVMLQSEIGLARTLMSAMMEGRRQCTDLACLLTFYGIDGRLARLLHSLTRWSRSSGGPVEIPKILSQEEMAVALGTAREVVTRGLSRLQRRGIIARRGRRIIVTDPEALLELKD